MKGNTDTNTHNSPDCQSMQMDVNGVPANPSDNSDSEKTRQQILKMVSDIIDNRQREIDYCQGWNDLITQYPEAAALHPILPIPPALIWDEVAVQLLEPLYRRHQLQAQIEKGQVDAIVHYIGFAVQEALVSIEGLAAKASIESSHPVLETYRAECLTELNQARLELELLQEHSLSRLTQIAIPNGAGAKRHVDEYSRLVDDFSQLVLSVLQNAQLIWRFFREKSHSFLLGMAASSESGSGSFRRAVGIVLMNEEF